MRPSAVSKLKTEAIFRSTGVDVFEFRSFDDEDDVEEVDAMDTDEADLRSSPFGMAALRHSSKSYYELGQMVDALEAVFVWRNIEDNAQSS